MIKLLVIMCIVFSAALGFAQEEITLTTIMPRQNVGVNVYDSGWFQVAISKIYTKAHGLGQTPHMVQVFWSNTFDGSGDVVLMGGNNYQTGYSMWVIDLDSDNIKIRTGLSYTHCYYNSGGTYIHGNGGYYKIVAVAFN